MQIAAKSCFESSGLWSRDFLDKSLSLLGYFPNSAWACWQDQVLIFQLLSLSDAVSALWLNLLSFAKRDLSKLASVKTWPMPMACNKKKMYNINLKA